MKSKLKAKLKEENPPKVTISTDGWTQHHDAFLGINGHYIDKNWIRKKINLACSVFNTEHTGINIWKQIDEVLVDWDLLSKVFEALRDNARNMVKSFEEGKIDSFGCLIYSIQLVIEEMILKLNQSNRSLKSAENWLQLATKE